VSPLPRPVNGPGSHETARIRGEGRAPTIGMATVGYTWCAPFEALPKEKDLPEEWSCQRSNHGPHASYRISKYFTKQFSLLQNNGNSCLYEGGALVFDHHVAGTCLLASSFCRLFLRSRSSCYVDERLKFAFTPLRQDRRYVWLKNYWF